MGPKRGILNVLKGGRHSKNNFGHFIKLKSCLMFLIKRKDVI